MAGHDVWHTPPELFRVLDAEFHFDVDVACHDGNALCPLAITEAENALVTPWMGGTVYCNPPYSLLGAFVGRAWDQSQQQKATVVLLIPAYTDPGYWWDVIVPFADEIRFLRGRVSFLENGQSRCSARFPSVVIVFRYRRGVAKGSPRVWWWDWKAETDVEVLAPLFSGVG
jgi:phage N-6-adenine-methyltransferase